MAYSIDWYIENEIIYVHYVGETTPDELRSSLIDIQAMIESSPRQLVHVISDVGDVTKPVSPKDSLKIIRELGPHPRAGWNIILREKSAMVKIGIAISTTALKARNRAFNTMHEAAQFLDKMDAHLNWDRADEAIIA